MSQGIHATTGCRPWHPIPSCDAPLPGVAEALADLWLRLEDRLATDAGAACRACGRCCDFPRAGHVLFAAKIELDACLQWATANLPPAPELARSRLAAGLCPFWRDNSCAVHPARPLGCRVYFCDRVFTERCREAAEWGRDRLAAISDEHSVRWWYGPALAYLAAALGSGRFMTA